MDNKEIYRKTMGFSLRRLVWDLLAFLLLGGLMVAGYAISEKTADRGTIGLIIGLIAGLAAVVLILRYTAYSTKAAQIAMMTRGVTEGTLPDDVIGEGKKAVKERFATVAVFFAVTGVIRGIFQQLGNAISSVGEKVGGEKGNAVGSAVSTVIQTIVAYLCDCCLGWVFYRKDVKATRATCEGAVLFFKHGKTLARNLGRVFGIGLLSLLLIGGVFTGIFYAVFMRFPAFFTELSGEFAAKQAAEGSETLVRLLSDPATLTLFCAAIVGVILWSILHSVFVRPFVLVGVLRNYMEAGIQDMPTEASFAMLDSRSKKFAKLHSELA